MEKVFRWGSCTGGNATLMHAVPALDFVLNLIMRWRGQEREEVFTSLLLILHFYFLKKKKVLLGIKIFHAPSQ